MADTFELEVATPERLIVRERATEAQIPAKDGFIGVLPGHAALLSELAIAGYLSYVSDGRTKYLSIHGGFLEILQDHVRVLTDIAEKAEEIDVERARVALQKAQEELAYLPLEADVARALTAMQRAQARLEAAQLHKEVK